jgi:hypothetical protein
MPRQFPYGPLLRGAAPLLAAALALAACGGSGGSGGSTGAAATAPSAAAVTTPAPGTSARPTAARAATRPPAGTDASGLTSTEAEANTPAAVDRRRAENLFVGNPTVAPVQGGQQATLTVRTKRPLACKVLYGTDANTSEGSAVEKPASARLRHRITIGGLAPRTQYFYRVQGADSNGRKHYSKVLTFYTAGPEGLRTPGKNVAVGAKVTGVSSQLSLISRGANAVDGDQQTEWVSKGDGDKAWISIDLGRVVQLGGVGFRTRSLGDGTAIIRSITVTGDDGKAHGPYRLGMGVTVINLKLTTRMLRFDAVSTTGGNTGAIEIEAYEVPKAKQN